MEGVALGQDLKVVREEAVWRSGEECFKQRERHVQRPWGRSRSCVGGAAWRKAGWPEERKAVVGRVVPKTRLCGPLWATARSAAFILSWGGEGKDHGGILSPRWRRKPPRLYQVHSRCSSSHGHSEGLIFHSLGPLQA